MMTMASTDPTPTPFFCLPLEVRLQIYDLTVIPVVPGIHSISDSKRAPCRRRCVSPRSHGHQPRSKLLPALLFTCRQIYDEATPVFYSRTNLCVTLIRSRQPYPQHSQIVATTPTTTTTNAFNAIGTNSSTSISNRNGPLTVAEHERQHHEEHAFCPIKFLRHVTTADVDADPDFEPGHEAEKAFQGVFRWLISSTGVRDIFMRKKPLKLARDGGDIVGLDGLVLRREVGGSRVVIDVCAIKVNKRTLLTGAARYARGNGGWVEPPKPELQIYRLVSPVSGGGGDGYGVLVRYRRLMWQEAQPGDLGTDTGVDVDVDMNDRLRREQERFRNTASKERHLTPSGDRNRLAFYDFYKAIHICRD